MKREHIEHILRELGVTSYKVNPNYFLISCILAKWTHPKGTDNKPSCGIKIINGVSPVNCFTCGNHYSLYHYVREYGEYAVPEGLITKEKLNDLLDYILLFSEEDSDSNEEIQGFKLEERPKPSQDLIDCLGKDYDFIFDNFTRNGVPRILGDYEYWNKWNIGYAKHLNRVLFPYFIGDEVIFITARWIDESYKEQDKPKVMNYPRNSKKSEYLYGDFLITPNINTLIVTEGILDVINGNYRLIEAGITDTVVVGLLGSKPSKEQIEKLKGYNVVLMLDNDDAGKLGQKQLLEELRFHSIVYTVDFPNEFKDVDELAMANKFIEVLETKKTSFRLDLEKKFLKGGVKL